MIPGTFKDRLLSFVREHNFSLIWEWDLTIPVKSLSNKLLEEMSQCWENKDFLGGFFYFFKVSQGTAAAQAVPDLCLFRLDSGFDFWK